MRNDLTLIIPYHNRAKFLPRTLASITQSSELPAQIILVNNASTDDSEQICQQFAIQQWKENCPITMLNEPHIGASAARNCALAKVKTTWVYFFDSDDEFDAHFLSDIDKQLDDQIDLLAVPTRMSISGRIKTRHYQVTCDPAAQVLYAHLNTQGMIFRTSFLQSIGGWNKEAIVWNDWELGLRALLRGARLRWLTQQAYHIIHIHEESITGSLFSQRAEERLYTLFMANTLAYKDQRILRALFLRHAILKGYLLAEHREDLAQICMKQMSKMKLKKTIFWTGFSILLSYLSSKKIPGTWRLAYLFLH